MVAFQFLLFMDPQDYDLTKLQIIPIAVILYQIARIINNYYMIFHLDQYPLGKQP